MPETVGTGSCGLISSRRTVTNGLWFPAEAIMKIVQTVLVTRPFLCIPTWYVIRNCVWHDRVNFGHFGAGRFHSLFTNGSIFILYYNFLYSILPVWIRAFLSLIFPQTKLFAFGEHSRECQYLGRYSCEGTRFSGRRGSNVFQRSTCRRTWLFCDRFTARPQCNERLMASVGWP